MQAHNAALKKAQKRKHANERAKVRNEKLARRNPYRLEKMVTALQSIPAEFRSQNEIKQLEEMEKELRLIKKARAETGVEEEEKAPPRGRKEKEKKEGEESESETDDEVRGIKLPPGPLPPLPGQEEKKQIVYEAKPILRDLRKEAAKFVPTHVKKRVGDAPAVTAGKEEGKTTVVAAPADENVDDELAKLERELQAAQGEEDK